MLRTVHLSQVYRPIVAPDARFKLAANIGLLSDMLENCIILVDPAGRIVTEMADSVIAWPDPERKLGQALLIQLKKTNRFVPCDVVLASGSPTRTCESAVAISIATSPEMTLLPEAACDCGDSHFDEVVRPVTVSHYPASAFAVERRDARRVNIGPREITPAEAERRIWGPIVRYAKRLTLVDQYIGRHIHGYVPNRRHPGAPIANPTYARGVFWILDQFASNGVTRTEKAVRIVTCVNLTESAGHAIGEAQALKGLMAGWSQAHGIPVTVDIHGTKDSSDFFHSRYLISDQQAWQVDAGFNLLYADGSLRATVVSTCSFEEREGIYRKLSNLPPRL